LGRRRVILPLVRLSDRLLLPGEYTTDWPMAYL
jgi:hypothetical protein